MEHMAPRQEEPAAEHEDAEAAYDRALGAFAGDLNDLHSLHDAPSLQSLMDRSVASRGRRVGKSTMSDAFNGKRLPSIDVTLRLVQLLAADAPTDAREKLATHWRGRWRETKRLQKAAQRQARSSQARSRTDSATDSAPSPVTSPAVDPAPDFTSVLPMQRTAQNVAEHFRTTPYEAELCAELPFPPPFYFFLDAYADVWSVFDRCDTTTTPLAERAWYRVIGHGPDRGWIIATVPPAPPVVLGLLLTPDKIRWEHIHKYLPTHF
jgi:hypothetical protein